jgi:hypothetical protein
MDQLSNLFQSSDGGGWLSKLLGSTGLKLGLAGSGAVGNIMANRTRNSVLQQQMDYTKKLQNMTPAEMVSQISALEQPLSGNLINSVTNATQGKLAERGLSQAPGIFGTELAQGLAPYQLQEQQIATDALFKKLGLPVSARPSPFGPFPQTTNTSELWRSLQNQFMGLQNQLQPNQVPNTSGIPSDAGSLLESWLSPQSGLTAPDFPSTQSGGG